MPVHVHLKWIMWIISQDQWQTSKIDFAMPSNKPLAVFKKGKVDRALKIIHLNFFSNRRLQGFQCMYEFKWKLQFFNHFVFNSFRNWFPQPLVMVWNQILADCILCWLCWNTQPSMFLFISLSDIIWESSKSLEGLLLTLATDELLYYKNAAGARIGLNGIICK